jgi:hypothetical protein
MADINTTARMLYTVRLLVIHFHLGIHFSLEASFTNLSLTSTLYISCLTSASHTF